MQRLGNQLEHGQKVMGVQKGHPLDKDTFSKTMERIASFEIGLILNIVLLYERLHHSKFKICQYICFKALVHHFLDSFLLLDQIFTSKLNM